MAFTLSSNCFVNELLVFKSKKFLFKLILINFSAECDTADHYLSEIFSSLSDHNSPGFLLDSRTNPGSLRDSSTVI